MCKILKLLLTFYFEENIKHKIIVFSCLTDFSFFFYMSEKTGFTGTQIICT